MGTVAVVVALLTKQIALTIYDWLKSLAVFFFVNGSLKHGKQLDKHLQLVKLPTFILTYLYLPT